MPVGLLQRLDTHHGLRFRRRRRSHLDWRCPVGSRRCSVGLRRFLRAPPQPSSTEATMRFYSQQHRFYCGVDLHARSMHVCIVAADGQTQVHKNIEATPDRFLPLVRPYRDGLVVAAECMFAWYWLADLCAADGIAIVLGHALYTKASHGGKTKNDKLDSQKIALLLKGGMLPMAYAYPKAMRATGDLLRRRTKLVRTRAEALAHIQNALI